MYVCMYVCMHIHIINMQVLRGCRKRCWRRPRRLALRPRAGAPGRYNNNSYVLSSYIMNATMLSSTSLLMIIIICYKCYLLELEGGRSRPRVDAPGRFPHARSKQRDPNPKDNSLIRKDTSTCKGFHFTFVALFTTQKTSEATLGAPFI